MGRGSREQVVGLEELMSFEISGAVTRSNSERRHCERGVRRSGEMGIGGAVVGNGVNGGRSDTEERDL